MLNITLEQLNSLTVSDALKAAVKGLRDNNADPLFSVDMDTYGKKNNDTGICFGCVATCAIASLNNELCSETTKESQFYGFLSLIEKGSNNFTKRLREFESAIDLARSGYVYKLFEFAGIEIDNMHRYDHRFDLTNSNWQEELPKVEALIEELVKEGL